MSVLRDLSKGAGGMVNMNEFLLNEAMASSIALLHYCIRVHGTCLRPCIVLWYDTTFHRRKAPVIVAMRYHAQ